MTAIRRLLLPLLAAAATAPSLSGCGGGLYIGWNDFGDQPPSVSLAVAPGSASAGQVVHLAAAAADDFGVDHVEFYRVEADGTRTALGSDTAEPYVLDTAMPSTSAASVQFIARAVDGAGQATDSDPVGVQVLR